MTKLSEQLLKIKRTSPKYKELTLSEQFRAMSEESSFDKERDLFEKVESLKRNLPKKETLLEVIKRSALINPPYTAWDAIIAWRDNLFYSDFTRITKSNYLSGMLKLIQEEIIDPNLPLSSLSSKWYLEAINKIDNITHWSFSTKRMRKSCLYTFISKVLQDQKHPACYGEPYRRKPSMLEIEFMLSIVENRTELESLDIVQLTETIRVSNERDALIVSTLFFTGRSLDEVLNIKPKDLKWKSIKFGKDSDTVPRCLIELLFSLCKDNNEYVFSTAQGNKLLRNQVIRSLKNASKVMGLSFEITPKMLQSKAILTICREKLSELEKVLAEAT